MSCTSQVKHTLVGTGWTNLAISGPTTGSTGTRRLVNIIWNEWYGYGA